MLSPECGPWSQIQSLDDPERVAEKRHREKEHVEYCYSLAAHQQKRGRGFAYEQPWKARPWEEPPLEAILRIPGVELVRTNMNMFGLRAHTGELVNESTGVLTNIPDYAEAIQRRCDQMHGTGFGENKTRKAGEFVPQFANVALRGLSDALARGGTLRPRGRERQNMQFFCDREVSQSKANEFGNHL